MKRVEINIRENNLRTIGFSKDGNINLHEAGIDNIYEVDGIIEFLIDREGSGLLEENISFEDFEGEENQKEMLNALLLLKEMAEEGYIYHDIETGEEWLGIDDEAEIYLNRGVFSDWGKFIGKDLENSEEFLNPKNWEVLEDTISIEEIEIPDGHGTTSTRLCFAQKNTEVNNPVNEYAGWMYDDFEILEVSSGTFVPTKK